MTAPLIVYNEIDPFAAAWLRELIRRNLIAPGEVWENDIRDIRPSDLRGVVQFHGFAGIGVWSYALRRAGWPDSRPVWTMSCPCQPFSAAGKGGGFDDERHLWPHAYWLVSECRPTEIFGEQVASKAVDPWIDLVHADLEAVGYAFASIPFPSAGVGAPHIRDRNYWMAHAQSAGRREQSGSFSRASETCEREMAGQGNGYAAGSDRPTDRLDDDDDARLEGQRGGHSATFGYGQGSVRPAAETGEFSRLVDADGRDASAEREQRGGEQRQQQTHSRDAFGVADDAGVGRGEQRADTFRSGSGSGTQELEQRPRSGGVFDDRRRPGPTNGFWRDPDWLFCRDDKWRPVEPGTFPLAHGAPARVGRLRGYGNAINAEAATVFIESYLETQVQTIDAERVRLTGAFE